MASHSHWFIMAPYYSPPNLGVAIAIDPFTRVYKPLGFETYRKRKKNQKQFKSSIPPKYPQIIGITPRKIQPPPLFEIGFFFILFRKPWKKHQKKTNPLGIILLLFHRKKWQQIVTKRRFTLRDFYETSKQKTMSQLASWGFSGNPNKKIWWVHRNPHVVAYEI